MRHKKALVIRHAAYGDGIMATSVIPYLARDGYEIHFLTSNRIKKLIKHHPRIARIDIHERDSVPLDELPRYYAEKARNYDKTVVLTGAVECSLLFAFPEPGYYKSLGWRRKHCDVNYFEHHVRLAGYEPDGPVRGELYFHIRDIVAAKNFRHFHKDEFIIIWALSGSSIHKKYLWYEAVARRVLQAIPEAMIITTGLDYERALTFEHPRVRNLQGLGVKLMTTLALTKYADLVIGPESVVTNAAGCFSTPKICFLTHSSKTNLTKHWINDFSMQAETYCSPCHLLHNVIGVWKNVCPPSPYLLNKYGYYAPACVAEGFPQDKVFERIMRVYQMKKEGKL
jgi:ADP-heptose:LPS heptosyltransferase